MDMEPNKTELLRLRRRLMWNSGVVTAVFAAAGGATATIMLRHGAGLERLLIAVVLIGVCGGLIAGLVNLILLRPGRSGGDRP